DRRPEQLLGPLGHGVRPAPGRHDHGGWRADAGERAVRGGVVGLPPAFTACNEGGLRRGVRPRVFCFWGAIAPTKLKTVDPSPLRAALIATDHPQNRQPRPERSATP